ncbi:MAG: glycosyltransferase [Gammaproteobacteria bacterium]|nr:glycosyltransferase [Gammaproteobacteria bacterium]
MPRDTPYVSVIVPVYHDWDRLRDCLHALSQQHYPPESLEIIVVNNDPADEAGTRGWLCRHDSDCR